MFIYLVGANVCMYVCGCVSIHACVHLACGSQQKLMGVFYHSLLYSFKEGALPESGSCAFPYSFVLEYKGYAGP